MEKAIGIATVASAIIALLSLGVQQCSNNEAKKSNNEAVIAAKGSADDAQKAARKSCHFSAGPVFVLFQDKILDLPIFTIQCAQKSQTYCPKLRDKIRELQSLATTLHSQFPQLKNEHEFTKCVNVVASVNDVLQNTNFPKTEKLFDLGTTTLITVKKSGECNAEKFTALACDYK